MLRLSVFDSGGRRVCTDPPVKGWRVVQKVWKMR